MLPTLLFKRGELHTRPLVKSPTLSASILCVAADAKIGLHQSRDDITLQALRGKGVLMTSVGEIALEAGVFAYIPAHLPHMITATEDLALLLTISHPASEG